MKSKKPEVLLNLGATPERLQKSTIVSGIREITKGGVPLSYGHRDTEHCALDFLLNRGYIENDQYDAGYQLRELFYKHRVTGRWIDEGSKAHDGEVETPKDKAYESYRMALMSVNVGYRNLIEHVCTEAVTFPTYYDIIRDLHNGLNDLVNYFTGAEKIS